MTRDEAKRLIARLEAAWPGRTWGDARRHEWGTKLVDLDVELATKAFEQLRDSEAPCPSIADFLGRYRAVRGPIDNHQAPVYVPTDDERERVHAYLAVLREEMAKSRAQASMSRWGKP